MNEERMLILKMIQEGKITAEEGAALLDALETNHGSIYTGPVGTGTQEGDERGKEAGVNSWVEKLEKEAARFARDMEKAVGKLSDAIEERLEKDVKPALANLPEMLSQIPFLSGWMEPSQHLEKVFTGEFKGGDSVEVELATRNGSVEVKLWGEPGYKVVLNCKVKARDDKEADERFRQLVTLDQGDYRLSVHNPTISGEAVNITAYLPKGLVYRCQLRTDNGKIQAEGLRCSLLKSQTANGTLNLEGVIAEEIEAKTANGGIKLNEVSVREAEASTANGHIQLKGRVARARLKTVNGTVRVRPAAEDVPGETGEFLYDVNTVNGGVTVELPPELSGACHLELQTQLSKIDVPLPGLNYELKEHKPAHNRIVARGPEFATAKRRISINARTVSGTITVQPGEETTGWDLSRD